MFTVALFTIVRTWKQPRCASADEWIRNLGYIYPMEYYLAIKRNTSVSSSEVVEISQKKKHQCTILMHICRIEKDSNDNPICKAAKETHM